MVLDTYEGVELIESEEMCFGLPVYLVKVAGKGNRRYRFTGETAYADAQRKMNDLILKRIHG